MPTNTGYKGHFQAAVKIMLNPGSSGGAIVTSIQSHRLNLNECYCYIVNVLLLVHLL